MEPLLAEGDVPSTDMPGRLCPAMQADRQQSDSPLGTRRSLPPRPGMPALSPGTLPPMPLPQSALQGGAGAAGLPVWGSAVCSSQMKQGSDAHCRLSEPGWAGA